VKPKRLGIDVAVKAQSGKGKHKLKPTSSQERGANPTTLSGRGQAEQTRAKPKLDLSAPPQVPGPLDIESFETH